MARLRSPFRRRGRSGLAPLAIAAGLGAGAVALMSGGGGTSHGIAKQAPATVACDIKGNISVKNGDRIYHMPGQKYYAETRINAGQGERWFCSEAEARAAGWRKSRV